MPVSLRRRLLGVALLALVTALTISPAMAESLHPYRWKNRIIQIATPTLADPLYQKQAALLLAAYRDLLERDIIVITDSTATKFTLTLIGKDGGQKLTRDTVLAPDELFAIIDAMPMRRQEMRSVPAPAN